jgi:D-aminopeptidase
MRVAIVFDMEGVSHIGDFRETFPFYDQYWRNGRAKLTADVAAAARGLLDGGAEQIPVISYHGAGETPWPNVIEDQLPDGAWSVDWELEQLAEHADAMFQVGCHARGGSPSFMSHTWLGSRWRMGDELLSESHEWAFAGDVPVLGIVGSEALGRERGPTFASVPYLAVQTGEGRASAQPIFSNPDESAGAIRDFAASAVREATGARSLRPRDPKIQASLHNADDVADEMTTIGWTRLSATEFAFAAATWMDVDEAIWAGVELASRPWEGVFPLIDWTEEIVRNLDEAVVSRADEVLERWSTAPFPEWYSPDESYGIEGFAGSA